VRKFSNQCGRSTGARLATGFRIDARTEKLTSSIHAVEHLPSAGAASIVPIRFVCTNRITRDDKLLLAFDSLVLSDILGRPVKSGKIIHGDQYATVKINTLVVRRKVQELVAQTASLLSTPSPPEIVLNRHCPACEFRIQCRQKAVEKDDLSLMSRMTAKERKAFHNRGIFTLTHLSYTFRPHRRATPKSKTALLSEAIFIGRLNLDEAILKSNEMTLNKGIDERFSSTN
jgi:predicted RecB family nuclease